MLSQVAKEIRFVFFPVLRIGVGEEGLIMLECIKSDRRWDDVGK